jgi:hypothetical protein
MTLKLIYCILAFVSPHILNCLNDVGCWHLSHPLLAVVSVRLLVCLDNECACNSCLLLIPVLTGFFYWTLNMRYALESASEAFLSWDCEILPHHFFLNSYAIWINVLCVKKNCIPNYYIGFRNALNVDLSKKYSFIIFG